MDENRIKYLVYLAGAIEAVSVKEMEFWREKVKKELASSDIVFYDPVEWESKKVGRSSKEQIEYIAKLKQIEDWKGFNDELQKIWWGNIDTSKLDLIRLLIYLKEKSRIEGNYKTDLQFFGDYEATARSDFIIAYMPKDTKTIGTLFEIHTAYLLGIPIYLILPDCSKIEANSTLIYVVMKSKGEIFYSIEECIDFIRKKYNLGGINEKNS